jgi:hypothetical protein
VNSVSNFGFIPGASASKRYSITPAVFPTTAVCQRFHLNGNGVNQVLTLRFRWTGMLLA